MGKFKSRKFLLTLLSVVLGVCTLFGVDEGIISLISGVGMIVIPTIIYILTEGKIDAASVGMIIDTADQIFDFVTEKKKEENEKENTELTDSVEIEK